MYAWIHFVGTCVSSYHCKTRRPSKHSCSLYICRTSTYHLYYIDVHNIPLPRYSVVDYPCKVNFSFFLSFSIIFWVSDLLNMYNYTNEYTTPPPSPTTTTTTSHTGCQAFFIAIYRTKRDEGKGKYSVLCQKYFVVAISLFCCCSFVFLWR